jgi:hydroxymethylpyrimidine pyrophosphatase-like HAD family hydrolase
VIDELLVTLAAELPECFFGWETATDLHYDDRFLAHRPDLDRPAGPDLEVGERPAPIRKLMIAHGEIHHYALLDAVTPLTPAGAVASTSGAPFVEVTGAGVDKAFGIQQVCEDLGITAGEVIAFGDNHNDITLLRWAGRGIAMGNAHEALRVAVDETTLSNVEDGVAAVLETLV